MFKKILNAIVNPIAEENSTKDKSQSNNEPAIIRPYTSQDSEEITKLLTNFDNATIMTHIMMLEKVVVNLVAKNEIQSNVIVRQSEILRDMHGSLEEILHLLESASSSSTSSNTSSVQHKTREEAPVAHNKKSGLN